MGGGIKFMNNIIKYYLLFIINKRILKNPKIFFHKLLEIFSNKSYNKLCFKESIIISPLLIL